jgi:hypothetical protein
MAKWICRLAPKTETMKSHVNKIKKVAVPDIPAFGKRMYMKFKNICGKKHRVVLYKCTDVSEERVATTSWFLEEQTTEGPCENQRPSTGPVRLYTPEVLFAFLLPCALSDYLIDLYVPSKRRHSYMTIRRKSRKVVIFTVFAVKTSIRPRNTMNSTFKTKQSLNSNQLFAVIVML